MGIHDQIMASAAGIHADMFGDSAIYTLPPNNDNYATPINLKYVTSSHETIEIRNDQGNRTRIKTRMFEVIVDVEHEMYCGVAEFYRNGLIAFDGNTYAIESIETSKIADSATLKAVRIEQGQRINDGVVALL